MQAPILSRDPRRPRPGPLAASDLMKAPRHARLDRGTPAARSWPARPGGDLVAGRGHVGQSQPGACPAVGGSRCLGPEPSLALACHAIACAVLLPVSSQLHAAARDLQWIAGGYSLILASPLLMQGPRRSYATERQAI